MELKTVYEKDISLKEIYAVIHSLLHLVGIKSKSLTALTGSYAKQIGLHESLDNPDFSFGIKEIDGQKYIYPSIDLVLFPSSLDQDCNGTSLYSEKLLELQASGKIKVIGTNLYPTDSQGFSSDGRANYGPKIQAGFLKFMIPCTVNQQRVELQVNVFSADMHGDMEYSERASTFNPATDIQNHTVEDSEIATFSWPAMVFKSLMDIVERRVQYIDEEQLNKNPKYVEIAKKIANHKYNHQDINHQLTLFWDQFAHVYTLQRLQFLGVKKDMLDAIESATVAEYFALVKDLVENNTVDNWAEKPNGGTQTPNHSNDTPIEILVGEYKVNLSPNI